MLAHSWLPFKVLLGCMVCPISLIKCGAEIQPPPWTFGSSKEGTGPPSDCWSLFLFLSRLSVSHPQGTCIKGLNFSCLDCPHPLPPKFRAQQTEWHRQEASGGAAVWSVRAGSLVQGAECMREDTLSHCVPFLVPRGGSLGQEGRGLERGWGGRLLPRSCCPWGWWPGSGRGACCPSARTRWIG